VPSAARVLGIGSGGHLRALPSEAGAAREHQRRTRDVRLLPWRRPRAPARQAAPVRQLPRQGACDGDARPRGLPTLPRCPRGPADTGVHLVPRERSNQSACRPPGRMRGLPPPPRPGGRCGPSGLRDVPCALEPPCAPRICGTHPVRELPRHTSSTTKGRPRHVHRQLPHRQACSPAGCGGVHGVSCLRSLTPARLLTERNIRPGAAGTAPTRRFHPRGASGRSA
jgi:hypothetical protein